MKANRPTNNPINADALEPEVREKALEIAAQLREEEIPAGMSREEVAVKRAQQWFLDLEG